MHIPAKRFTDGGELLNKNPSNEMTADEYKFCKFIIRILLNFSDAIKESFLTHLKLTGLKEKLNIDESFFDIHFVNPLSYELYEQARILMQRIEMYKAVTEDGETFSKTIAMKKYLNFTNDEVEENWLELEREKIRMKLIEAKSEAVVEDEMESFKERLAAERAVKNQEEDTDKTYDSTEDVIDDATTVKKSDQVIQNGVEQMADQLQNSAQQQGNNSQFNAPQQQPQQQLPVQQPQQTVPQQQKLSDLS
jgi:predicted nucleotidyltransferase